MTRKLRKRRRRPLFELRWRQAACYHGAMARSWVRIAHRGASGSAPELTRAAIERALEIGVDMVEVDVQLTSDGHPIILHDEMLDRTTTGTGVAREKTWDEIRELDAGSWFAPAFSGERLLDLAGLIELVRDQARLNLEIKAPPEDWPLLIPRMCDELRRGGIFETTVFSCFDIDALRAVRAASTQARLGVLWYSPDLGGAWQATEELDAKTLHAFVGIADAALFAEADRRGIDVYVWTVNSPSRMQQLVDWGAAGVMTDHPELFGSLIPRRSAAETRG